MGVRVCWGGGGGVDCWSGLGGAAFTAVAFARGRGLEAELERGGGGV